MISWVSSLVPYVPFLQLIAYSCLTLTTIIVASVSLRFSYRQNFGWAPILLVAQQGVEITVPPNMPTETTRQCPFFYFEVWNRRAYPIVVKKAIVRFNSIKMTISDYDSARIDDWFFFESGEGQFSKRVAIKNGDHHLFKVKPPASLPTSIDIDDQIELSVDYFDPRRNASTQLKLTHNLKFKALL